MQVKSRARFRSCATSDEPASEYESVGEDLVVIVLALVRADIDRESESHRPRVAYTALVIEQEQRVVAPIYRGAERRQRIRARWPTGITELSQSRIGRECNYHGRQRRVGVHDQVV